jgi:hypothetical protein
MAVVVWLWTALLLLLLPALLVAGGSFDANRVRFIDLAHPQGVWGCPCSLKHLPSPPPANLRLVASLGTAADTYNYLFRGDLPVLSNHTFAKNALDAALRQQAAAAGVRFPSTYYLTIIRCESAAWSHPAPVPHVSRRLQPPGSV